MVEVVFVAASDRLHVHVRNVGRDTNLSRKTQNTIWIRINLLSCKWMIIYPKWEEKVWFSSTAVADSGNENPDRGKLERDCGRDSAISNFYSFATTARTNTKGIYMRWQSMFVFLDHIFSTWNDLKMNGDQLKRCVTFWLRDPRPNQSYHFKSLGGRLRAEKANALIERVFGRKYVFDLTERWIHRAEVSFEHCFRSLFSTQLVLFEYLLAIEVRVSGRWPRYFKYFAAKRNQIMTRI